MANNTPLEDAEQLALAFWLDQQKLLWLHVPNEGLKSINYHVKMKARGLKRGVPDNFIFTPVPSQPHAKGVAIELKRIKGGSVSLEQRDWINNLRQIGWVVKVCKGATEAIDYLKSLGYGTRPIVEVKRYGKEINKTNGSQL